MRVGSMDDIGSRLQHLTDLYELWTTGLDILSRYDSHMPHYEERKKELENATKLLMAHMEKDCIAPKTD